jgi:glycine hydroxymethyltransferase
MTRRTERYPHLKEADREIYDLIQRQTELEATTLKMIASENYASFSVLEASGSILTNKYCEGYPGARYYEGNEVMDEIENLAIERAKTLFGAEHANMQPYSGSPANQAVYRALVRPGDKVMGMPVPEGGHITHGWQVNFSGRDYKQIGYGPDPETGVLDYDQIRDLALKERPRMIWVGATAYPRTLEYDKFAAIADKIDAYLVADIAHINGLIVAGVHPDPVPYCDVVSSTSHKMLRGPRAGFILSRIEDRYHDQYHSTSKFNLAKRIDRAVFPGIQGGPHMQTIAAMAVAFKEAATEGFRQYGQQVQKNARALAEGLQARGYKLSGGGTDTHLLLMDLRESEYSGKQISEALAKAGIVCNFNMVPGDHRKPFITSGVRMGTPALTSMGMKEPEMDRIAGWMDTICRSMHKLEGTTEAVRNEVAELCLEFAPPGIDEVD